MAHKLRGLTSMFVATAVFLGVALTGSVDGQWDPYFTENRTTIVHLFEWRWNDIADECERFLGPYGYGGVQTSPPNENVIADKEEKIRPWWERYQPVSYKLETRSGTEEEFKSMVNRCNAVGVRIYIDAVINHMAYFDYWGRSAVGTGGSWFDSYGMNYSGVPYSNLDFNGPHNCQTASGTIENYTIAEQVRNCKLGDPGKALADLNQGSEYVQEQIVKYMNKLISFGIAGFRVDASKHMWPDHLKIIYGKLNPLSVEHGFPSGSPPFIFQEVIDLGGNEGVAANEYYGLGRITEFKGCASIGRIFRKWPANDPGMLKYLGVPNRWGEGWGFMPEGSALSFVDNHDNQRGHGAGGDSILTFRVSRLYKMAQAFTLAYPYGVTRVMSSYYWDQDFQNGTDKNDWVGPPHDESYNTLPVTVNPDLTCGNGWICEHRWRQIYNMVRFRNTVKGTGLNDWWDNGKDQIAFSRGDRGFIAINNEDYPLHEVIQSGLPAGRYCDVITGNILDGKCTGTVIIIDSDRKVPVSLTNESDEPILALHVDAIF